MAKDYGRREKLGNHFYLWVPEDGHVEGESRVVISAHGSYHPCFMFNLKPQWRLNFYSKLGQPLAGSNGPAVVLRADPVQVVTSKDAPRTQNYFLRLYQKENATGFSEESFQDIRNFVESKKVCVITVRPYSLSRSDICWRWRRLSNLLNKLEKAHPGRFQDVLCSFCRSQLLDLKKRKAANHFSFDLDLDDFEIIHVN